MNLRVSGPRLADLLGPDPGDGPRYRSVADGVRALIADARLLDGTRLPSERELVAALGVSRTTITRAYADLADSGHLLARHGSGSVVTVPGERPARCGEPIGPAGSPQDVAFDLTCASPSSVPGVASAMIAAADQLPRFAGHAGYFPEGLPELRTAIAARYTQRGLPTTAEQILITAGALSATALVMSGALEPRSRVVVETPGYPNTVGALRNAGHRTVAIPASDEFDFAGLERLLAGGGIGAMIVVADFHNPTGRLLSTPDRDRLARLWRRHKVLGIVDETLVETWLEDPPQSPPVAAFGEDIITIGSASKTYWGGLRMGWIRSSPRRIAALATARRALDLSPAVIDQLVLTELMRRHSGLPEATRQAFRASRDLLLAGGRSLGWTAATPRGGLTIWWHLPVKRSTALVTAAARRGIALHSGSAFAVTGSGLDGFVRTPYALSPERTELLLPLLREAAQEAGAVAEPAR